MHWPGRYKAGLRSNALVESIDIAPTILEAAGIPVPPTMQGRSLDGLLRGKLPADHHKDMVFCEFIDSMGKLYTPDHTRATMSFDGRFKLVSYYGHDLFELFDLEEDPDEFDNLWDDPRYRDKRWEIYRKQNDALAFNVMQSAPRTMLF
jgi:arylsulfatase A-like enzyme